MWVVSQSQAFASKLMSGHRTEEEAVSEAVARLATQKVLEYLNAGSGVGVDKLEL
jgi:hypothetical protein